MEKFSFLKFVKISFLALGLSSLVFTSCKSEDPDPKTSPEVELPGEALSGEEFSVIYPEGHTFGVWNTDSVSIRVGDHVDVFKTLFTMDKKSEHVRIIYYTLVNPATVTSADVESLNNTFKNDFYCEDNGFELMENEAVSFAECDARKLVAMEVEHQIYTERYIFFSEKNKKVYSVVMQLPDTLRDSRYNELKGILASMKIK